MKKELRGFVAGALTMTVLSGGMAFAQSGSKTVDVFYDNIKVYIDNVLTEPKDANGDKVEPFIMNGTTYLPVRGVASAMGADVTWDGNTKSVYIWDEMVASDTFLLDVCQPYEKSWCTVYPAGKTFKMDGKTCSNGIVLGAVAATGKALFNLDGKFSTLSFDIGHYEKTGSEKNVTFIVDGKEVKTVTLEPEQLAEHVTIPLNYGLQLKIITDNRPVGIANMTVK